MTKNENKRKIKKCNLIFLGMSFKKFLMENKIVEFK